MIADNRLRRSLGASWCRALSLLALLGSCVSTEIQSGTPDFDPRAADETSTCKGTWECPDGFTPSPADDGTCEDPCPSCLPEEGGACSEGEYVCDDDLGCCEIPAATCLEPTICDGRWECPEGTMVVGDTRQCESICPATSYVCDGDRCCPLGEREPCEAGEYACEEGCCDMPEAQCL